MLPPDQRLAANALVSACTSASVIVGPALAGFLAAAVGPAWIIGLDALSFAFLAVRVARIPEVPEAAEPRPTAAARGATASCACCAGGPNSSAPSP